MKLTLVPEAHPISPLCDASDSCGREYQRYFFNVLNEALVNPQLILDPKYWKRVNDTLLEAPQHKDLTKFARDVKLANVDYARRQLVMQCNLLKKKLHPVLYKELNCWDPIPKFATDLGIEHVCLDAGNEPCEEYLRLARSGQLTRELESELQVRRENVWLERITRDGYVIAGGTHISNYWGLVSKLEKRAKVKIDLKISEYVARGVVIHIAD